MKERKKECEVDLVKANFDSTKKKEQELSVWKYNERIKEEYINCIYVCNKEEPQQ